VVGADARLGEFAGEVLRLGGGLAGEVEGDAFGAMTISDLREL
jgi:hypothetical protein